MFSRGFALINIARINFSFSPLPRACSLTSADLFNNTYLFPSRGLGYSTVDASMRAILLSYCYATGRRL
jgi:hypothetical protein